MSNDATGTLFGVSLGPGDPDLITRRAWQQLNSDALWVYPIRKLNSPSYALAITENAGLETPPDATALQFPMTSKTDLLQKYWLIAATTVNSILQSGRDVCFLVEGDASTYSTFSHLARTLLEQNAEHKIEVTPGISSYHAAAASIGTPLADTDDTIAIIPAAYGIETISSTLKDFDTVVLLKVKPLVKDILILLEEHSLTGHACFIEKVGSPDERIIKDITTLDPETVNYLSLMIVHNPDRVKGPMIRGCKVKAKPTPIENRL